MGESQCIFNSWSISWIFLFVYLFSTSSNSGSNFGERSESFCLLYVDGIINIFETTVNAIIHTGMLYIPMLEKKHPDNHHIDARIRETLQQLRDEGYIKFLDKEGFKGLYQKLF